MVVTTFNPDYPLIRFGTGDLSAILPGISPCGRTNARIKGWMGRADQTTKVKGMFVHPGQIAQVVGRHREIKRGRLIVTGDAKGDVMTLHCEVSPVDDALAELFQARLHVAAEVDALEGRVHREQPRVVDDLGFAKHHPRLGRRPLGAIWKS